MSSTSHTPLDSLVFNFNLNQHEEQVIHVGRARIDGNKVTLLWALAMEIERESGNQKSLKFRLCFERGKGTFLAFKGKVGVNSDNLKERKIMFELKYDNDGSPSDTKHRSDFDIGSFPIRSGDKLVVKPSIKGVEIKTGPAICNTKAN